MTIDEIIAEYDRREALMAEMLPGEVKADEWRARDAFARRHFARLVAVAKAAVELVDADENCYSFVRLHKARLAIRAAVRGEGKEKGK